MSFDKIYNEKNGPSVTKRIKKITDKSTRVTKFYDTGTTNKSFLQVAKDLQSLGIKNYYFMLEIYDYSLVNIDPFSPNLTRDQVSRIVTECTRNIWYFLREIARIPSQGGPPVPYIANRGNIAQTWCMIHGIDSWLCLPRQQGKTQSFMATVDWAYSFGTNNSDFIFINKDSDNSKANLERLKNQIDCLPEYLKFEQVFEEDADGKMRISKAIKNATSMKHPITKNRIITKPGASSYEKALNLARGLTAPIIHYDEAEFTKYIKTIVENSVSTYETASRNAKANGALYGRCFTSTPGDLETSSGQDAQELLSGAVKWTEQMYDKAYDPVDNSKNEVLQYIKSNGSNDIVYIEYSYKQLGLSDEWARDMYNKIGNPITYKREILLQRLRGSSDSPFEQEDIEYIMTCIKTVVEELYILEHFRFDIYEKLERHIPYIVGIDCSTGTNGDSNAITIINPYTVEPVGEFKCPYIGETMFENLIIELVKKYIPRAILVIERNSVGDGIIDHLLNTPIRNNLYFDKDKDLVEANMQLNQSVTSMLKKQGQMKKYYGVYTGVQSREDMMAILFRRMAEFKDHFITKNITNDIAGLVRTRSGKIEAGPGFHDDSVMSYLIALYVYYHGNNLSTFGFIKGSEEIKKQNNGIPTYDDIAYKGILPQQDLNIIKLQEKVRKENDYEKIMKEALLKSQRNSIILNKKGLSTNSTYEKVPENLLEDYYNDDEDLSMFDELNSPDDKSIDYYDSNTDLSIFDELNNF